MHDILITCTLNIFLSNESTRILRSHIDLHIYAISACDNRMTFTFNDLTSCSSLLPWLGYKYKINNIIPCTDATGTMGLYCPLRRDCEMNSAAVSLVKHSIAH